MKLLHHIRITHAVPLTVEEKENSRVIWHDFNQMPFWHSLKQQQGLTGFLDKVSVTTEMLKIGHKCTQKPTYDTKD